MILRIPFYRYLLLALILSSSGFLFLTDDKRAGLPYLRELYILLVIAAASLILLSSKKLYSSRTTWCMLFLGLMMPLASAILANLNFGQPLAYGLLEERRIFLYLLYFPMLLLLKRVAPSEEQVERYFIVSGLACATVGFLYHFGVLPENTDVGFTTYDLDPGDNPLRPDRFAIGANYVNAAAFILIYGMRNEKSWAKAGALLYMVAYLWLVWQTRQIMLMWVLATLWVFRTRVYELLKMSAVGVALFAMSWLIFPQFYSEQYQKFLALLNEATNAPGVRDGTIATILKAQQENWFIGMGALSQQWNGGFSTLYNPYFFLSDVGIFGTYYRFGLLTPLVLFVFYAGFIRVMGQCKTKGNLLNALRLQFWIFGINIVLSNALTFAGDILGLTAALFVYYARVRSSEKTTSTAALALPALRLSPSHPIPLSRANS